MKIGSSWLEGAFCYFLMYFTQWFLSSPFDLKVVTINSNIPKVFRQQCR